MSEAVQVEKAQDAKEATEAPESSKLAVILVRGIVGVTQQVKDTLRMLNLTRKNSCVVVNNTPSLKGMIMKVKDYVTWGEISDKTYQELVNKKGREFKGAVQDRKKKYSYKHVVVGNKKYAPDFRLNPPLKGFGRKGIKVSFKAGGALGYRGEKMNELLARMI